MDFNKALKILEMEQGSEDIILPVNDPRYKKFQQDLTAGRIKNKKPLKKKVSKDGKTVTISGDITDLKNLRMS